MEELVESMMHEYMTGTYALKLELKNVDSNKLFKNMMKDIIEPAFVSDISQL